MKSPLFATFSVLALVTLASCVGPTPQKATGPLIVRGVVRGLEFPQHANIDVYRVTDRGIVERMQGINIKPATDGRFQSEPLNPDLYLFAMRSPGRPPSIMRVPVPPAPPITLVARPSHGLAQLEIRRNANAVAPVRVLLSRVEEGLPVVDRRPATVGEAVALIEGLGPGRWRLDVLGTGATTEIDVPEAPRRLSMTLDAPTIGVGVQMKGRILRADGEPATGLAVTIRPLAADGSAALAWGRYALTDSDGGYHLVAIPPGPALLRIESREAVFRRVPLPEIVTIPPSGALDRSFVVTP